MKNLITALLLTLTGWATISAQTNNSDMFILGGELSNSAATSIADIDVVMPRMKTLGLNTVLVPAYWEFLEPEEGQFDFTLIDRTIQQARQQQLKVVFLWLGAWMPSAKRIMGLRFLNVAKDIAPFMLCGALVMVATYFATMAISNIYLLLVVRILMATVLYYGVMRMLNVVILRECMQYILKKK